jgi:hypothetical protein
MCEKKNKAENGSGFKQSLHERKEGVKNCFLSAHAYSFIGLQND